jgi:hypothetical protein
MLLLIMLSNKLAIIADLYLGPKTIKDEVIYNPNPNVVI